MRRAVALLLLAVLLLCLSGCQTETVNEFDDDRALYETVITVATWAEKQYSTLYYAVALFNQSQQEVYVDIVDFDPEKYMSVDDSINQAYIEFVTGEAPDLFYMAPFDAAKLRNAGLIQDWYPIMDADPNFQREEYQTHIWELLETDGQLYQLCVSFNLFGIGGSAALYGDRTGWTLEEFESFLAENEAGVGTSQERLLQLMLWYGVQLDYIDFDTKTCRFEDQAFLDWLALLQRLPKEPQTEHQITALRVFRPSTHLDAAVNMEDGGTYQRYMGLPNENGDGPAVAIDDSYAISSTTEKIEACWTYLKWLLSYETQDYLFNWNNQDILDNQQTGQTRWYSNSYPIHGELLETMLETSQLDSSHEDSPIYGSGVYDLDEEGNEVLVQAYPGLPQEEVDYLRQLIQGANRAATGFFDYQDITAIIEEEVLAFLAGDKTAEECAHLIQSRVSIMLAEME